MTDHHDLPPSNLPAPDLPAPDLSAPDLPAPDLLESVALGRLAPSVHNTQPWRFQIANSVLDLHADLSRRLDALDPDGRQLTVSCGAALFHARLALRLQGYDSEVEVIDGMADPSNDLLARIAPVPGTPATEAERALADAARRRHTQRGPFLEEPVDGATLAALRAAVEVEGAWVRLLTKTAEQIALAVLLNRAEDAESADEAYRAELATWTHRPDDTADGVPQAAVPANVRGRHTTVRGRDFSLEGERGGAAVGASAVGASAAGATVGASADQSDGEAPPVERPLVAVIGTLGDGLPDWLVAGQAMAHLLLRAAVDDVQASPLGQVVDLPWARRRLGAELGSIGHPQMVLRLGYGTPGPASPRRDLRDVLG